LVRISHNFFLSVVPLLFAVVACGGLASSGRDGGGESASSGGGSSGGGGGPLRSDSGADATIDSGGGESASSGGGSSDGGGGPLRSDSGADATIGPLPDSGAIGVSCAGKTCVAPLGTCCVTNVYDGGVGDIAFECESACAPGSGGFSCTSSWNCSSRELCCCQNCGHGGVLNAQCTDVACTGWRFCQSIADCDDGSSCVPIPSSGNFGIMTGICGSGPIGDEPQED
jgi:hypothetical protein